MSLLTIAKTSSVDFVASTGHIVETIPLGALAPTVGDDFNRASHSTIVVQAPTAIQRTTVHAQTQNTSSPDKRDRDNEDHNHNLRITPDVAKATKAYAKSSKKRNILSRLFHKEIALDSKQNTVHDILQHEVDEAGTSIPTLPTIELVCTGMDDNAASGAAVRANGPAVKGSSSLELETKHKKIPEDGVLGNAIPPRLLDYVIWNIADQPAEASIADAPRAYEVGDTTFMA
ncbi:hypothetical protein POJ06DRAFT_271464 [Lipomyces tetrasporus]|uniref:Uncharacterized protein n=1 Tax=Lipomyces tetrasporus TaxID=54092 RepID=A0AAD7QL36_9ASCO|nr:uncharacterized protein POJ06DRAFT_271464 [Lipomyces tetrasporus]KAJ8097094.1 hypothetical protein POJ06DRAFT_271464 [Lipomyces tetrasporus]